MITYCATDLTHELNMSVVTIHLVRQPLDPAYGHFVIGLLNTTQYDACFVRMITVLSTKGE